MPALVGVDVGDLQYAEQKAARLEADLADGGVSFTKLIGDARNLITAVRIITKDTLPATSPASSET